MLSALSQMAGTALLLRAMAARSFAIGLVYSKSEVIQVALFSIVFLGERPSLAHHRGDRRRDGGRRAAVAARHRPSPELGRSRRAVRPRRRQRPSPSRSSAYRGANLALGADSPFLAAAETLFWSQLLQTLLLGGWLLAAQASGPAGERLRAWRLSLFAGGAGASASLANVTALALEPASHVRTLILIEVLFTYTVSLRVFREAVSRRELAGIALVVIGVGNDCRHVRLTACWRHDNFRICRLLHHARARTARAKASTSIASIGAPARSSTCSCWAGWRTRRSSRSTRPARFLYSVHGDRSEVDRLRDRSASTGHLRVIGRQPTGGYNPIHLAFDATGKFLFVTNYGTDSIAVLPGEAGRHARPLPDPHDGQGHARARTAPSRRTCGRTTIRSTARASFFYLPTKGADSVITYRLDPKRCVAVHANEVAARPGAGAAPHRLPSAQARSPT